MGLFSKFDKPLFLKEDSDASIFIKKLKSIRESASGNIGDLIDKEIKLATYGEFGENTIAFELKNSGMPMYVIHDIHIEIEDLSAQIDYIVITKKITFIIECKNLIGNIDIDHVGNFVRNYQLNGKWIKEGIYSPITQNQRHMDIIKRIRKESKGNIVTKALFEKYFDDKYKSIVVLANPKTVLNAKYAKKEIKEKVIRADQLIKYIKDMNRDSGIGSLSDKEMEEYANGILKLHTPNKTDYAKRFEELTHSIELVEKDEPERAQADVADTKNVVEIINSDCSGNDDELIKHLKAFRLQKSREENIKPYFIFNDAQMMDLIRKMPKSKEDLLEVSGFGSVKVEKYGEMIVDIIMKR